MANKKSLGIIVYNNDIFDTKVVQTTKMSFYRAGMRVCILWNKPSEYLKRVVSKICSEGINVKDIVFVIISTKVSANRLFETLDGELDLYVHFLHPLMNVEDSGNNKICIINGNVGEIKADSAYEPEDNLKPDKNKKQAGRNTSIVISHEINFIEKFIPIIFECNGIISKSVAQYQETLSHQITYITTDPEMQLSLI